MTDVELKISGDNQGLLSALEQAKAAVQSATGQMKSALEGLNGVFEKVSGAFAAITAVIAGGKGFQEAVNASVGAALSARDLGTQLGITASQASVLKVAMGETGVSQDALSGAAAKITRTLSTNEGAFTSLGVATRDANGNFRNTFDIMEDVNSKLEEFKSGTDRNVEATKIYGKGWQEVAPALRLTQQAMQEAQEKAASLGLIVGERGVAQAQLYQKTMSGVGDVFEGVWKVLGESLQPALIAMGQWFSSIGPGAIALTKAAVIEVVYAFEQVKVVIETAWELAAGMVEQVAGLYLTLSNVITRVVHGDFSGAKDEWDRGWQAMQDSAAQRMQNIQQHAKDAMAQIRNVQGAQQNEQPIAPQGGQVDTDAPAIKSQMAQLEAGLAQNKAIWTQTLGAQDQFQEFSKEQELEYWQGILQTAKLSSADKLAILRKIWDEQTALGKDAADTQLATLKEQEAAHKGNLTAQLQDELAYAAAVYQTYGEESKEYQAAQAAIIATQRQVSAQLLQINEIRAQSSRTMAETEIQNEQAAAKQKYEAGRTGLAQYLAAEREFEAQLYALKQEALAEQLQLEMLDPQKNATKIEQQLATVEGLAQQHQGKMNAITQQGQQLQAGQFKTFQSTLQQGFATSFKGIIDGTMTVQTAFQKLYLGLLNSVATTLAQIAAKWVAQHVMMLVLNKEEASSDAGAAAAAAAKSAAQVPYIGWILAPLAAAATFVAASSYGAEGGFEVPAGLNPVTQLHQREMVLPANLADVIRGMAASGTSGGGGTHNYSIKATDAKSFARALHDRRGDLAKAVTKAHRQGYRPS